MVKVNSHSHQTKIANATKSVKSNLSNRLFTFFAVFGGTVAGAYVAFLLIMPVVRTDMASATSNLNKGAVQFKDASDTLAGTCAAPVSTGSASSASTSTPSVTVTAATTPASTAIANIPGLTQSSKIVSGIFATEPTTISDTGPQSSAVVKDTNVNTTTVTNTNTVTTVDNNSQSSSTGSVNSKDNTTAGSATSGDATNSSDSTFEYNINN
jgi:hypothetical protein